MPCILEHAVLASFQCFKALLVPNYIPLLARKIAKTLFAQKTGKMLLAARQADRDHALASTCTVTA